MDPGTIGLLVAEGSALAAIAAAYSLGREPTKTTTTTVPPTETAAPAPAPAPAPVPAPDTAVVPAPVTASPPPPPAPAPVEPVPTQDADISSPLLPDEISSEEDPKNLDEIIDEVIAIAKTEAAKPPPKSVFQRMREYRPFAKTRDRITEWQTARNEAYKQRMKAGRRKTVRRGGANPVIKPFVAKIKEKLYAISEPTDQKPQIAFTRLVSAGNPNDEPEADKVATLLLPILNTFTWWRFNVLSMKLRYSPIMVADAETLYADIKTPEQIQRMFAYNNRTLYNIKYPPTVPPPDTAKAAEQAEAAAAGLDTTKDVSPPEIDTPLTDNQEFPERVEVDTSQVTTTPQVTDTSAVTPATSTTSTTPAVTLATSATPDTPTTPAVTPDTPQVTTLDPGAGTGLFTNTQLIDAAKSEPLEIPPELQVKLDAAREKFETLKAKITNEEMKPGSPFAKPDSKQKRRAAALKAAETRQKNKVIAARNAIREKEALESNRKKANEARNERARKRAGIVSQPVTVETTEPSMEATVESVLGTAEASTNEIADSLKALEPTSASQNWFMDIENELQMYFEYYNQVERDLADVPPVVEAPAPMGPPPVPDSTVKPPTLPSDTLTLAEEAIEYGKEGLKKSAEKQKDAKNRLNALPPVIPVKPPWKGGTPKKRKQKKTRKLTFRRSRKQ